MPITKEQIAAAGPAGPLVAILAAPIDALNEVLFPAAKEPPPAALAAPPVPQLTKWEQDVATAKEGELLTGFGGAEYHPTTGKATMFF